MLNSSWPVRRIGIVWSGSVTFKKNNERAQPLMRFFQAFALPGVQNIGCVIAIVS